MPQLNKDAHLVPTEDDKTDNIVASVLGKDQPNILSFNQRPKERILFILKNVFLCIKLYRSTSKSAVGGGLAPKIMVSASKSTTQKNSKRHIPKDASRIMDAPNLIDDYYSNLIDWVSWSIPIDDTDI